MTNPTRIGDRATLYLGDCLEVLKTLPDNSVDAVVTDPPAGISFMGKGWDGDKGGRHQWTAWLSSVMAECLRVLKPGGHALVWALPRTSHWTGTALEDAGFEVRDKIVHLFGSGFPKSLDVSKAIDKAAGAEREVLSTYRAAVQSGVTGGLNSSKADANGVTYAQVTAPATDAAKQWQGWGTALKPAAEDWWLCRKPLIGTVAANVLAHGTGAINVDGCRVETNGETPRGSGNPCPNGNADMMSRALGKSGGNVTPELGRWPANLLLSGDAPAMVDEQSGELTSGARAGEYGNGTFSSGKVDRELVGSIGGASRFYYCPKADTADREEGLEGMEAQSLDTTFDKELRDSGGFSRLNFHPTVKSTDLMRWLVRLITPPGGVVLDPFMGSGSTGKAAMLEANRFIGIELDPAYFAIAERRIRHAAAQKRMF
jgi:site-specific DNA-methyltransferase (adenine-specific)